jgi:hypothetical protein
MGPAHVSDSRQLFLLQGQSNMALSIDYTFSADGLKAEAQAGKYTQVPLPTRTRTRTCSTVHRVHSHAPASRVHVADEAPLHPH